MSGKVYRGYLITPKHEPDGEGNGWEVCAPEDATSWLIENANDDPIASADTYEKAVAYIDKLQAPAPEMRADWRELA